MSIWSHPSFVRPIALAFGLNMAGFAISAPLQTEKYYDAIGSLSFVAGTSLSLYYAPKPLALRSLLLGVQVATWATRLGSHLINRMHHFNADKRFDKIKNKPLKFFGAWFVQACWNTCLAGPAFLVAARAATLQPRWGRWDILGLSLWASGLLLEATADYQKFKWQKNMGEKRREHVLQDGVWSLSRHPNYAGEIMLWTGFSIQALTAVSRSGSLWVKSFACLPAAFTAFILLRVSGIPLMEKEALKRYRDNKEYQDYRARTNVLIPWFPKSKATKSD